MTGTPTEPSLVTALLHGVLEHEPGEWAPRLEVACAAHPALATELRRRFGLLCEAGFADPSSEGGQGASECDAPRRLGEFRLLRRLGAGGMGMVFAAEQSSLQREVAVKIVRPEYLFAVGARDRFRREIAAIARLDHPAIVPVLTHGEDQGTPYYVMPLVRGASGEEVIARLRDRDPATLRGHDLRGAVVGTASTTSSDVEAFAGAYWQACVRLVRQLAFGLQHAHERGIVHRDVKPSNVLCTAEGRALLLDFGLAHVRDDARLTRTGAAPGSPAYMAPEQMRGQSVDARADVYSLAATLHHLLALDCPFPLRDAEVMRSRILAGTREPLRNRAVPNELHVVLAAAMDVDPNRRYVSAAAFADDLDAVLEQRSIRARPMPLRLRALRWSQRHPALATALSLGILVLAGTPTVIAVGIAEQRNHADAAKQLADRNAYVANIAAANTALQVGDGIEARTRLDACSAELRGFEWHHLHDALDGSLRQFAGHTADVSAVAITDDARVLASGDADGQLFLWQALGDATPQRVVLADRSAVRKLEFTEDQQCLVVLQSPRQGRDFTNATAVTVLDVATATVLAERSCSAVDEQVVIIAGGRGVLVARSDFTAEELDARTLARRRLVALQPCGRFSGGPLACDGTWLCSTATGVRIWRLADGKVSSPHPLPVHVRDVVLEQGRGAIALDDGRVFALACDPLLLQPVPMTTRVLGLSIDRGGRFVVGASEGTAVQTLDVRTGSLVATAHGAMTQTGAVAVASRRLLVAAGGRAGALHLFGLCGGLEGQALIGHSGIVAALTPAPDGTLLSGSHEPAVRAWHPGTGRPLASTYAGNHWVHSLAIDADRDHVFSAWGHSIMRMRLPDLALVDQFTLPSVPHQEVWATGVLPMSGDRLVVATGIFAGPDGRESRSGLLLVDYGARTVLQSEDAPVRPYLALVASPDQRHVLSVLAHEVVRWEVGDRLVRKDTMPTATRLAAIAVRDSDTLLVTDGATVSARRFPGGEVLWQRNCSSRVSRLCSFPDRSRLMCGHEDGTVSLWNPDDGTRLVTWRTCRGPIWRVESLAVHPAGDWVAAGAHDGQLALFCAHTNLSFAGRLAHADAMTAQMLDQETRRAFRLREDALAAVVQRDDVAPELRDLMMEFERMRSYCTWEDLVAALYSGAMLPGMPAADYERAVRVGAEVLRVEPGSIRAHAAKLFGDLRLGRFETCAQACAMVLNSPGDADRTLLAAVRAAHVLALVGTQRLAAARAELALLEQGIAANPETDVDNLQLLHEARRAVAR